MDEQSRNLILATVLSVIVIVVWTIIFPPEVRQPPPPETDLAQPIDGDLTPPADTLATPPGATEQASVVPGATPSTSEAVETERLGITTPRLTGSIALRGGRIDDLSLLDYRVSVDPDADIVTLLSPASAPGGYYALHGWAPGAGLQTDLVPGSSTPWQVESGTDLAPGSPITLVWDNGAGQVFRKTISVDENYLFTVTQSLENQGSDAVRAFPYGQIVRHGLPPGLMNFFVLHEGLIQMADGTLNEDSYGAFEDYDVDPTERMPMTKTPVAENGWIGLTDHYWMTTLAPSPGQSFTAVAKYLSGSDIYQTEVRLPTVEVAPGQTHTAEMRFFAGAKEWAVLRDYQNQKGIDRFVDAIDWGWFYFLTKPLFWVLHYLNLALGNMGWAIIGLTLVIKSVLFPLAYKSYAAMSRMKALQPEMEKIKERAGDDRQKLQQEMMALYKKEKVNPASGCLPILVQIPIFFSLYKVIFVTIELRHAPFIGWIRDLSAPDPSSFLNMFGLLPWGTPGPESIFFIFSIGVLPILMGVTMWLQQKLNPAPTDPTQAAIFAWMPWIFMFMLGTFAAGLVLYWTVNNIITFAQQYIIMRSQGVKPDIFGNIVSGFRKGKEAE